VLIVAGSMIGLYVFGRIQAGRKDWPTPTDSRATPAVSTLIEQ
jgi:hypothetical protein